MLVEIKNAVKIAMDSLTIIWNQIDKIEISKQSYYDLELAKAIKRVKTKTDRKFKSEINRLNKENQDIVKKAISDGINDHLDLTRNKGTKKISSKPISALNFTSMTFLVWVTENQVPNMDWEKEGRIRYQEFSGKVMVQDGTHKLVYNETLKQQLARIKKFENMS